MRADKLSKLKIGLLAQQNIFVRQTQVNQSVVQASFRIAQLIASSGKPFTNSEFVKQLIFIHGGNANFEMCEELAALQSLKGTTTGGGIFGKVCQIIKELDLDWSKLSSITTDGAPSMVGMSPELIGRMNLEMEERGLPALLQVHRLIH